MFLISFVLGAIASLFLLKLDQIELFHLGDVCVSFHWLAVGEA